MMLVNGDIRQKLEQARLRLRLRLELAQKEAIDFEGASDILLKEGEYLHA